MLPIYSPNNRKTFELLGLITSNPLAIKRKRLQKAVIETYNDHRMAMGFAVAGLAINGIRIKNPNCVAKSFPDFWKKFNLLYKK